MLINVIISTHGPEIIVSERKVKIKRCCAIPLHHEEHNLTLKLLNIFIKTVDFPGEKP